jgi:hypothetical protein
MKVYGYNLPIFHKHGEHGPKHLDLAQSTVQEKQWFPPTPDFVVIIHTVCGDISALNNMSLIRECPRAGPCGENDHYNDRYGNVSLVHAISPYDIG